MRWHEEAHTRPPSSFPPWSATNPPLRTRQVTQLPIVRLSLTQFAWHVQLIEPLQYRISVFSLTLGGRVDADLC